MSRRIPAKSLFTLAFLAALAPEIARAARLDPAAVAPVVAANAWTREVRPRCFTGTKSRRTGHHLAAMFGAAPIVDGAAIFWSREMIVPLACAVIGSAPILKSKLLARPWLMALGYVVQFALFIVSISCLVMNAHNPFIYFNF